jgi:hypothetical protein
LSLGANPISFAISCGVVLNNNGEVINFEVCPSKIKITKRITYIQLDEILNKGKYENVLQQQQNKPFSTNNNNNNEDKINEEYSDIIESLKLARASVKSKSSVIDSTTTTDLIRLNHWAIIRHNFRIRSGALDEYLRHKTELYLTVKKDLKSVFSAKVSVAGFYYYYYYYYYYYFSYYYYDYYRKYIIMIFTIITLIIIYYYRHYYYY